MDGGRRWMVVGDGWTINGVVGDGDGKRWKAMEVVTMESGTRWGW
jgi:hypothetical protein